MININELTISQTATLKTALAKLDTTAQSILLMVNQEGELIRVITDGDIRRLLLKDIKLEATLEALPQKIPIVIRTTDASEKAIHLMNEYQINHIPVIDEKNIPRSLFHRRDISHPILLSPPHLGEYEQQFVAEAFATNWIAPLGPHVDAFEREIAEYVGAADAAAMSSGTAAIHLALILLDIGPNDIVFCSDFTFVASANPIKYQFATPVFIDSDPDTWNMSPIALEKALTKAKANKRLPKAVIVVNLYGQCADMDSINELCNIYNIPIIEDAAESLGSTYKNKASGNLTQLGVFSFNGNKIITTSGGGMLVSNNKQMIERARFLASQAREKAPYYEHTTIGYNYRMSNVLAGIGRGQLRVLNDRITARRTIHQYYVDKLSDISSIEWMPEASYGKSNHWLTTLLLNKRKTNIDSQELINELAKHNIEARRLWKPMHLQPLYCNAEYYLHSDHSISADLFERGICLPSGSSLSKQDQDRVIEAIHNALK